MEPTPNSSQHHGEPPASPPPDDNPPSSDASQATLSNPGGNLTEAKPVPVATPDEVGTPDAAPAPPSEPETRPGAPMTDRLSPAEIAASFTDPQDPSLDQAVEEAMQGITEADLSGAGAPTPKAEAAGPESVLVGRVANIGSEDILIDFDGKSLGSMQLSELDKDETLAIGDRIEVMVLGEDPLGGLLKVSRRKAQQAVILREMKVGQILECRVIGMNRGGLEVDIRGLRGFIPASQVDVHFLKDISDLIGRTIRAEVIKFDRDDDNIVLSRRRLQLREEAEKKEKLFAELKPGEIRRGKVRSLTNFGAFVDIGGADGLLHISDMSWGRVSKPDEVVKVGDEIDVKILKVNREKKKISLGLKQTVTNPWQNAGEKYSQSMKLQGRVVRLVNFGAFVELEPGLDGLLPVSEMSWTRRIRHPSEIVKEGDVVEVSVINVEPEKKRITLSLKQLVDDPWSVATEKHPVGTTLKGKVVRTTDFGAFVDLGNGIDGMIHISELADERVRSVTDKVKTGDEVEVRVLVVDTEAKKISLSMRKAPPEPTSEEAARPDAGKTAAAKKKKAKPRRGGITFGWDEGLSGLDPSKFAR